MNAHGISTVFHYVPLHDSPAGKKYGWVSGDLKWTNELSGRLVRLPLWSGMERHIGRVIDETVRLLS